MASRSPLCLSPAHASAASSQPESEPVEESASPTPHLDARRRSLLLSGRLQPRPSSRQPPPPTPPRRTRTQPVHHVRVTSPHTPQPRLSPNSRLHMKLPAYRAHVPSVKLVFFTTLAMVLARGLFQSPTAHLGPLLGLVMDFHVPQLRGSLHMLFAAGLVLLDSLLVALLWDEEACTTRAYAGGVSLNLVTTVMSLTLCSWVYQRVVAPARHAFLSFSHDVLHFFFAAIVMHLVASGVFLLYRPIGRQECSVLEDVSVWTEYQLSFGVGLLTTAVLAPPFAFLHTVPAVNKSHVLPTLITAAVVGLHCVIVFVPSFAVLSIAVLLVALAAWAILSQELIASICVSFAAMVAAGVHNRVVHADDSADDFHDLAPVFFLGCAYVFVAILLGVTVRLQQGIRIAAVQVMGKSRTADAMQTFETTLAELLGHLSSSRSRLSLEQAAKGDPSPSAAVQARIIPEEEPPPVVLTMTDPATHLNDVQSRFLTGMSHELLTPAHGLMGNALLLETAKHLIDPSQHAILDDLCRTSEHMCVVLRDLIEFSKVANTSGLQLKEDWFRLPALFDDARTVCSPNVAHRFVEVLVGADNPDSEEAARSLVFFGDSARILQIIARVAGNAVKFSPSPGKVLVRVSVSTEPPARHVDSQRGSGDASSPSLTATHAPAPPPSSRRSARPQSARSRTTSQRNATYRELQRSFLQSAGEVTHTNSSLPTSEQRPRPRGARHSRSDNDEDNEDDVPVEPAAECTAVYMTILVTDDGPGMNESELHSMWVPFGRKKRYEPKEGGRGVGLGLNLVEHLVHRMDGSIAVDTAPGRGTRFEVMLPLWAAPDASSRDNSVYSSPGRGLARQSVRIASPNGQPLPGPTVAIWSSEPLLSSDFSASLARLPLAPQGHVFSANDAPPPRWLELDSVMCTINATVLVVCVTVVPGWQSPELDWLSELVSSVRSGQRGSVATRLWISLPSVLSARSTTQTEMDEALHELRQSWRALRSKLRRRSAMTYMSATRPVRPAQMEQFYVRLMARQVSRSRIVSPDDRNDGMALPGCAVPYSPAPSMSVRTSLSDTSAMPTGALLEREVGQLTVMLVDDDRVNRRLAVRLLQRCGVKSVIVAKDGVEAVEKFHEHGMNMDVVFMDITMPRMDGIEATRRIRELLRRNPLQRPPLIAAISGNTTEEDREVALSVMDVFIGKPFFLPQLKEQLHARIQQTVHE